MAQISVSISVLDIPPARDLFKICADMVEDDRVPPEYRIRITETVRSFVTNEDNDRPVVIQFPIVE